MHKRLFHLYLLYHPVEYFQYSTGYATPFEGQEFERLIVDIESAEIAATR